MTDRELLELAAKAIGLEFHSYVDSKLFGKGINTGEIDVSLWNPLDDDGDALRLAVEISFADGVGMAMFFADADDQTVVVRKYDNAPGSMEIVGDDPYATTRRAIVRAAAEIGKAMESA